MPTCAYSLQPDQSASASYLNLNPSLNLNLYIYPDLLDQVSTTLIMTRLMITPTTSQHQY